MIHYQLICDASHGFDGWFKDSAAFDHQAETAQVACPTCGSTAVNRALMAPRIAKRRRAQVLDSAGAPAPPPATEPATPEPATPTPAPPPATTANGIPDHIRGALQRLRAEVERNCEHVGPRFAEEARAIHRGETTPRPIYGDATPEQAEALADEGIELARIPWVPRADS